MKLLVILLALFIAGGSTSLLLLDSGGHLFCLLASMLNIDCPGFIDAIQTATHHIGLLKIGAILSFNVGLVLMFLAVFMFFAVNDVLAVPSLSKERFFDGDSVSSRRHKFYAWLRLLEKRDPFSSRAYDKLS